MSNKALVWIVQHGQYSDRSDLAVCSTEVKAQELEDRLRAMGFDDLCYDAVELDPELISPPAGTRPYDVWMDRDGDSYANEVSSWYADRAIKALAKGLSVTESGSAIEGWVLARDEKHAIKIANDARAQLIATNQWKEVPNA